MTDCGDAVAGLNEALLAKAAEKKGRPPRQSARRHSLTPLISCALQRPPRACWRRPSAREEQPISVTSGRYLFEIEQVRRD